MNKIKFILVSGLVAMLSVFSASAQTLNDVKINEVLVDNVADFEDDFGMHSSWIEFFNSSHGTIDIGGCYLSNDPDNLTMYIIPKADVLTKISPRQHVLFWADGLPYRGTFHISFKINEGETIYFVSSDGKTILDQVTIPVGLQPDQSYGRDVDGIGEWNIREWTSPSTNNSGVDDKSKAQIMGEQDPHGFTITIIAMAIVFTALLLLFIVFKFVGKFNIFILNRKSNKTSASNAEEEAPVVDIKDTPAAAYAAIAMALYLYQKEEEAHDFESLMLTQKHTDRTYSPWSSKIYNLRQTPTIKKNQR